MSGDQLPMNWPGAQQQPQQTYQNGPGEGLPVGPPQFVQPGPSYGSQPPAWVGAVGAPPLQQFVVPASMIPPTTPPPFEGGTTVAAKTSEQLVAEAQAADAAKKAQKALEKELRKKWATPWDRFNSWHAEFGFTLDAEADETNHKLPRWIGPNSPLGLPDIYTVMALPGERIFWNSAGFDEKSVRQAWALMGSSPSQRPQLIVQIRPANQTEQPFWQELVEQYRDFNGWQMLQPIGIDFRVRFITPRVEFVPPPGVKESGPRSGHVLLIWRNTAAQQPAVQP